MVIGLFSVELEGTPDLVDTGILLFGGVWEPLNFAAKSLEGDTEL